MSLLATETSTSLLETPPQVSTMQPINPYANAPTRALYQNLAELAKTNTLFGHQWDMAYGVYWKDEPGRSDVKEVAGSYPAIHGWDATWIADFKDPPKPEETEQLRQWMLSVYERGGLNDLCWHNGNPVSKGKYNDNTRSMYTILPGGKQHEAYKAQLDQLATFFLSLKNKDGECIPVIFRPFHEMTGSWFWWGGANTTPEEYKKVWRFTVDYLVQTKKVPNLLFSYSTDAYTSPELYMRYYPGDDYVDIMGFDDYKSVKSMETMDVFLERLHGVVDMAEEHGKIPALTETGFETIPNPKWWTEFLLAALNHDEKTRRIAYVLVWRNAFWKETKERQDDEGHFFAPFPGHPSAPDFVEFTEDPLILLEDDLPNLYGK